MSLSRADPDPDPTRIIRLYAWHVSLRIQGSNVALATALWVATVALACCDSIYDDRQRCMLVNVQASHSHQCVVNHLFYVHACIESLMVMNVLYAVVFAALFVLSKRSDIAQAREAVTGVERDPEAAVVPTATVTNNDDDQDDGMREMHAVADGESSSVDLTSRDRRQVSSRSVGESQSAEGTLCQVTVIVDEEHDEQQQDGEPQEADKEGEQVQTTDAYAVYLRVSKWNVCMCVCSFMLVCLTYGDSCSVVRDPSGKVLDRLDTTKPIGCEVVALRWNAKWVVVFYAMWTLMQWLTLVASYLICYGTTAFFARVITWPAQRVRNPKDDAE